MSALLLASLAAAAQSAVAPPSADSLRGTVAGVVYDSVARAPLAGADVQLVRADDGGRDARDTARVYFTTTDRAGRYRLDGVAPGSYEAAFFHPRLDSLGVSVHPSRVDVAVNQTTRLALALPSATNVQRQICTEDAISDTTALVVGFVRDAATLRPLDARDSAVVRVEWAELSIGRGGLASETRGGDVRVRPSGWFAACGVPTGRAVSLRALSRGDTSGRVPIEVVGRSVAHRDLLVGAGATRLVGTVRSVTGQPIAGARVSLLDGADTATTAATGTFALAAVPVGSRAIEARAVGFLPARQIVDVRADGADGAGGAGGPPAVAEVTLTSFSAYLDTVRVTRQQLYTTDRNGFEYRRKASGSGYFIDRARIDRFSPITTSELFRLVGGISRRQNKDGTDRLAMHLVTIRGVVDCEPETYVDGVLMNGLASDSKLLNFLVTPDRVDGIEVYPRPGTAPAQFTRTMSGCGSIVIWTRAPDPAPARPTREKPE